MSCLRVPSVTTGRPGCVGSVEWHCRRPGDRRSRRSPGLTRRNTRTCGFLRKCWGRRYVLKVMISNFARESWYPGQSFSGDLLAVHVVLKTSTSVCFQLAWLGAHGQPLECIVSSGCCCRDYLKQEQSENWGKLVGQSLPGSYCHHTPVNTWGHTGSILSASTQPPSGLGVPIPRHSVPALKIDALS